jgi:hypothetical protein
LITAPGAPSAEADAEADAEALVELVGLGVPGVRDEPAPKISVRLLLLHAARIDPSSGADMPTTLARRMKSRRDSRPVANSSMMWFAISPWPRRSPPSRRWSIFGVMRSLPGVGRILHPGLCHSSLSRGVLVAAKDG